MILGQFSVQICHICHVLQRPHYLLYLDVRVLQVFLLLTATLTTINRVKLTLHAGNRITGHA